VRMSDLKKSPPRGQLGYRHRLSGERSSPYRFRQRMLVFIPVPILGILFACGGETSGLGGSCAGLDLFPIGDASVIDEAGGRLELEARDGCGSVVSSQAVTWSSSNERILAVADGSVTGVSAGKADITAESQTSTATLRIQVVQSSSGGEFVARGVALNEVTPSTGDFWISGNRALLGSNADGCPNGADCTAQPVLLYDLTNPDAPTLIQTIPTPTTSAQDVKISADGSFAVVGMQALDAGIVVIDLSGGTGTVVATFRDDLERGVHNLWIEEIDGVPYVFAAENGFDETGGLHILDLSQIDQPIPVAHYYGGSSGVHDVYVRDGLAFVSHWDLGLVILDVGNGIAGGDPRAPVEVSRTFLDGETHNVWYWPAAATLFVGEEDFLQPEELPNAVGRVHVLDVSDMFAPVETATFSLGGTAPHNFWMDEDEGILFVAWYEWGIRAIDVNGALSGELADQGRELAAIAPFGPTGDITNFFSPQLHNGRVYAVDTLHGIWVFEFERTP